MNTNSLLKVIAIGLAIGLIIMACLYIAASVPNSDVQAMGNNTVSHMRPTLHTATHYTAWAEREDKPEVLCIATDPWGYGNESGDQMLPCNNGSENVQEDSHPDNTGSEVVTDNTPVIVDNPVDDTPAVVDTPTNDDNTTVDNPPADDSGNDTPKDDKHDDNKGNPGNMKNVGNAGEKTDKGMNENHAPSGDCSENGQHGNSDNPDKGNNKNK